MYHFRHLVTFPTTCMNSSFIPSGICSTVSMRHEGERPVQKYRLKWFTGGVGGKKQNTHAFRLSGE